MIRRSKLPILKDNPLYSDLNTDFDDEDNTVKTTNEKNKSTKEGKRAEKVEKEKKKKEIKDFTEEIDEKMAKNNREQANDLLVGINKGFDHLADVLRELMTPKQTILEEPTNWQKASEKPVTGQNEDQNS